MKTCISTYSFHRAPINRFEAIDRTAALGADGVEFVLDDNPPEGNITDYALRLTEHAREKGLATPIYTTGANLLVPDLPSELARVKKHIDAAAACGIPLLRHDIAWGIPEGYQGLPTFETLLPIVVPAIRELADYAGEKGVVTCSENHGRLFQDSERMSAVFQSVGSTNYRFLCDIGNFGGVDEDCEKAVGKLLPLISHVHAKDAFFRSGMLYNPGRGFNLSRAGNYRRPTIFGHGNVPTFQILHAIRASGYDGFVSLEFEGMEETFEGIEIGLENLKRMLRDLS